MAPEPISSEFTSSLLDIGTSPRERSEGTLVERLALADTEAFRELILTHQNNLINYLTRLCGCKSRAEDLAQDSFIRLFRAVQRHPSRDWQLRPYLYRIAVNLLCSQERRSKYFTKLRHVLGPDKAPLQPQDQMLRQEAHRQVTEALAKLPMRFRVPLVMREIEGWRLVDIAKCLQLNEGTVKSRIHRGKQHLKTLLTPYWQGGES